MSTVAVDYLSGAGGTATVLAFVAAGVSRVLDRFIKSRVERMANESIAGVKKTLDDHEAIITGVRLELAKQFGGNSGGIRQAINELTKEIAFVKGVLSKDEK